ncbi:hypothetical protein WOSG25_071270 [Weissella oryzae SG25]|uniref:Gram-positive cocci surface proteins LPxTG domain-containing protein n=1 Tax=Weissella oryzae (strain DSM 25784 / JCM 18191 / LMG 30913 / SG25) TaxID=1329250 RepID=A0A069CTK2_WEIOS|nr:hypothetical protein [Weissella oryzae]GAK31150.1 hypothetical protein WOSG25_071270 [Weissella oryzae SG25]
MGRVGKATTIIAMTTALGVTATKANSVYADTVQTSSAANAYDSLIAADRAAVSSAQVGVSVASAAYDSASATMPGAIDQANSNAIAVNATLDVVQSFASQIPSDLSDQISSANQVSQAAYISYQSAISVAESEQLFASSLADVVFDSIEAQLTSIAAKHSNQAVISFDQSLISSLVDADGSIAASSDALLDVYQSVLASNISKSVASTNSFAAIQATMPDASATVSSIIERAIDSSIAASLAVADSSDPALSAATVMYTDAVAIDSTTAAFNYSLTAYNATTDTASINSFAAQFIHSFYSFALFDLSTFVDAPAESYADIAQSANSVTASLTSLVPASIIISSILAPITSAQAAIDSTTVASSVTESILISAEAKLAADLRSNTGLVTSASSADLANSATATKTNPANASGDTNSLVPITSITNATTHQTLTFMQAVAPANTMQKGQSLTSQNTVSLPETGEVKAGDSLLAMLTGLFITISAGFIKKRS